MEWIGRFRNIFTCHSNTNFLVIWYFYLIYIFHFMSKNYLISCASSFFTYRDAYVCILTLVQTIPCNWQTVATPSAILKPRVSSVCSDSKVGTVQNSHVTLFWTVPLLFWESGALRTINGAAPPGRMFCMARSDWLKSIRPSTFPGKPSASQGRSH